jgi:hypothetical protein
MLAGFLALPATAPRPGAVGWFLGVVLIIFIVYVLTVRALLRRPHPGDGPAGRRRLRAVFLAACLFRAALIAAPPALSSDMERYLWDGRVVLSGRNPYLEPPAAPALAALRDGRFAALQHRDVRTIYPPLAQLLFAAGAAPGWGPFGLKLLLVAADLLAIALLARILRRRGQSPLRVLIYAWNPLAVIEIAWSGHLEPAGLLCLLVAALAIIQKRPLRATLGLALGGLVKIAPWLLVLPLLRAIRPRFLCAGALLVGAAYWPFRAAGARLFDGLRAYADRWVANESLFRIVEGSITALHPTPLLKAAVAFLQARLPGGAGLQALDPWLYPPTLARLACALLLLACAVLLLRRRVEPLRAVYLFTGALLLLSPTLHPWYLLWILPWLALFPSPAWILLSGLILLSYLNLGSAGVESEPWPWVRLVEYLPFYALLAAGWLRRRGAGVAAGGPPIVPPSGGW